MPPKRDNPAENLLSQLLFFLGWLFTGIVGLFAILLDLLTNAYWSGTLTKYREQRALEDRRTIDGPLGSTENLITKAQALTVEAAFPSADQFLDAFIERYKNDTRPLSRFLCLGMRVPLAVTAHNLYAAEHFERPPSFGLITGAIDAGRYRDQLALHIRKVQNPPETLELIATCIAESGMRLTRLAPPSALQDIDGPDIELDEGISVPLSSLIPDIEPLIEEVIAPFSDPKAVSLGLFGNLRSTLKKNREKYNETKDSSRDPLSLVKDTELERIFSARIPFAISEQTRFAGHWIVAPPGRGKTTLLHSMVRDDLEKDAALILIDSKGDLINPVKTLQSVKDRLLLIEPTPDAAFALNPLDVSQATVTQAVSLIEYIMAGLLDAKFTALQSTLFRNVVPAIIEAIPNATLDTFKEVMVKGLPTLDRVNPHARQFFENRNTGFHSKTYESTRKEVVWRLDYLMSNPILRSMFSATHTKLDIGNAMDAGKVVIVNNSKAILGDEGAEFFGRFFVALIARAAQQRSGKPAGSKKPCYVYIDECQTVIAKDTRIPVLLDECRSQKIALILSHQRTAQLTAPVLDAVANCAIRMANSDDEARFLSEKLRMPADALRSLPRGTFGTFIRDFTPNGIELKISRIDLETLPQMTDREMNEIRIRMRTDFSAPPQTTPPSTQAEPMQVPSDSPQPHKNDDPDSSSEY